MTSYHATIRFLSVISTMNVNTALVPFAFKEYINYQGINTFKNLFLIELISVSSCL